MKPLPLCAGLLVSLLATTRPACMADAASPLAEFDAVTLHADQIALTQNRADVVMLFDCLRQVCERDRNAFAQSAVTHRQAVADYETALRPMLRSGAGHVVDTSRRWLKEKFGYEPDARLELAVRLIGDENAADAAREVRRFALASDSAAFRDLGGSFNHQLSVLHRATHLARADGSFRTLFETSLSALRGQPFRVADQSTVPANVLSLLATANDVRQRGVSAAVASELSRHALAQVKGNAEQVVNDVLQLNQALSAAYEQLRRDQPGRTADARAALLPANLFRPLAEGTEAARAERVFQIRTMLGLASQVAALGGDRSLALKIDTVSELYAKTEQFAAVMAKLSDQPSSFANTTAMAAATGNWLSLAISLASMASADQSGPSETEVILQELNAIKQLIHDLGKMLESRLRSLEFGMADGFSRVLGEIAQLRFDQQATYDRVLAIERECLALQRQSISAMDRTLEALGEVAYADLERKAKRSKWSEELRQVHEDLVTLIVDDSSKVSHAGRFVADTARAEIITRYGAVTQDPLPPGGPLPFSHSRFLREYFQSRTGSAVSLGAPNPPNLAVWLRGVGLLGDLRRRFPQLQSDLSAAQLRRIYGVLANLEQFPVDLGTKKTDGTKPDASFTGTLFENELGLLRQDLQAVRTLLPRLVREYASLPANQGFDCWQKPDLGLELPSLKFSAPNIPATGAGPIRRVSSENLNPALTRSLDEFKDQLPDALEFPRSMDLFRFLFTDAEHINHLFAGQRAQLGVKLVGHGWQDISPAKRTGTWTVELALTRGGEPLRTVVLSLVEEPFAPPSDGTSLMASNLVMVRVPLRPAGETARLLWETMAENFEMMQVLRGGLLRQLYQPELSPSPAVTVRTSGTIVAKMGRQRIRITEALAGDEAAVAQGRKNRETLTEKEAARQITALRSRFLADFLGKSDELQKTLARYEENRVAFYLLVNLAAPQSLQRSAALREALYGKTCALPPREALIDDAMCESARAFAPQMEPAIGRLRSLLLSEYRARRFPQMPAALTFARLFCAEELGP